jgi:hypothetical protein
MQAKQAIGISSLNEDNLVMIQNPYLWILWGGA